MDKMPNFFIVGAPKAGTSSLYYYLNESPDVFISKIKEPHFFSSDYCKLINFKNVKTRKDYLKLFENATKEKAVGEASVGYLQATEAPGNISSTIPNAKIIIMLKDPVERFFSHYLMLVRSGSITQDFSEVLTKYLNESVSKDPYYYALVGGSYYYDKVRRYLRCFKNEQVKIIIFEEFIENTKQSLQSVFDFLNIDSPVPENINQIYNEFALPRNQISLSIMGNQTLKKIVKRILPRRTWTPIRETIFVKKGQTKPEMKNEDRERLVKFYQNDVKKIKDLLGRELPWPNFQNMDK